jgi:hypothetical protein
MQHTLTYSIQTNYQTDRQIKQNGKIKTIRHTNKQKTTRQTTPADTNRVTDIKKPFDRETNRVTKRQTDRHTE